MLPRGVIGSEDLMPLAWHIRGGAWNKGISSLEDEQRMRQRKP